MATSFILLLCCVMCSSFLCILFSIYLTRCRGGTPCGVKPIENVPGVENFDVTSMVETHTKYADAIPNILRLIRFCEP